MRDGEECEGPNGIVPSLRTDSLVQVIYHSYVMPVKVLSVPVASRIMALDIPCILSTVSNKPNTHRYAHKAIRLVDVRVYRILQSISHNEGKLPPQGLPSFLCK